MYILILAVSLQREIVIQSAEQTLKEYTSSIQYYASAQLHIQEQFCITYIACRIKIYTCT